MVVSSDRQAVTPGRLVADQLVPPPAPPRPRRYEVKRLSDGEHYALKVTNIQELKPQVAHEVVQEIRWV